MRFRIRSLNSNDIPDIARIYVEAYADSTWAETWKYDDALHRITELATSPLTLSLICQVEDNIVGCIFGELLSWHTGKQLEIKEVFVSPNYRGQGIGRNLLKGVEDIGKENNVSNFFLWTNNHRKLVEFYEHMGYYANSETIQFVKNDSI